MAMAHTIDIKLPVQFEDFYVLSYGEINTSPSYHGVDYIWPIGYKSCWHEKITGSLFTCEVSDYGDGGPVFTVRRSNCSTLPIPCGSTVLFGPDLKDSDKNEAPDLDQDEYDSVVSKLPDIISLSEIYPGSSSTAPSSNLVFEDVIGELSFQGSSPFSAWRVLLEKISDVYQETIKRNGALRCYCGHVTDLPFLSCMHFTRQTNIDNIAPLNNFLHSQHHAKVPSFVQGVKESNTFSELLMNRLRGYQFGLDIKFVQESIEQLPGVESCSRYVLIKDRLLDSNKKVKIKKASIISQPFPSGSLISSRLSSYATGNLLQVHEFLSFKQEDLGVEDCLSFEDLENELLASQDVKENFNDLSNVVLGSLETLEMNCIRCMGEKLSAVHMALLPRLISKLLFKIARAFNLFSDVEVSKKKRGRKKDKAKEDMIQLLKLDVFPVNQLTWPEVVRRCILACLLMGGQVNSLDLPVGNNTKLIRCLQGDDGFFSGSSNGVAGADLDAQLLGRAVDKVFGKLKRERSVLSIDNNTGTKVESFGTDFTIPEWAKVLDPVRKLPTNVGSRIRNCVRESLNKNPPEWAKKLLEASIAKDVYKGNASGPTKRAVIDVLKRVSDGSQRSLPPVKQEIKSSKISSDIVMKKCRVILRQVAARDVNRVFSDLIGRNINLDGNNVKIVYKSASIRPLDLRTIDLRLAHNTYCGSHEAFLEDVKELWINLRRTYMNRPNLVKLVDEMSIDFKSKYEKEVTALFRGSFEYNMNGKSIDEIEKEVEKLVISKVPWETGICKICGLNKDDKNVLLCDTEGCNAEYHTYCLNPPLFEIPEGNWYCPTCVPPNPDNKPKDFRHIFQFLDETNEETRRFLEIATALKENEYWELETDNKTFLLKFISDELLKIKFIRKNLTKHSRKEFFGCDSDGRLYWGSPDTFTHCGVVVNDNLPLKNSENTPNYAEFGDLGAWRLFQSDEEIKNLVNYLKINDPMENELRNSILKWKEESTLITDQQPRKHSVEKVVCSQGALATKASKLLEAKYSPLKKPRKNMAKWHRCDCLEPVLPSRYHCFKCHETFLTNIEFEQHKNLNCGLSSVLPAQRDGLGVIGPEFGFSECSLKPIVGKGCDILRQLKINLLDMEAALADGARRASRAGSEWRSAWCSFVKSANTIYEMVEASLVLETMIKTEYISNTWWWYWSSVSAAAKTSTISALALRIYTLDAAIDYQKTTTPTPTTTTPTTSSHQKQSKKRKRSGEKAKEQCKKPKQPEDKKETKDNLQLQNVLVVENIVSAP